MSVKKGELLAVVGGNGAEGKAQSGGDAGKPCGEVHFDFSLCGPSGLSVSAHRRGACGGVTASGRRTLVVYKSQTL